MKDNTLVSMTTYELRNFKIIYGRYAGTIEDGKEYHGRTVFTDFAYSIQLSRFSYYDMDHTVQDGDI